MKLHIKYMVSNRCKIAVKEELKKLGLHDNFVNLGEIDIIEDISVEQRKGLKRALFMYGFELMDNKKAIMIEKVKNIVIEMIHYKHEKLKINFSNFLSNKLCHNYSYLANLFSEDQRITIEQFIILHKVERIKELIIYDELNIKEIASEMSYSSVAHLSNQFKKVTGLSPSGFKQSKDRRRIPIEEIGIPCLR